MHRQLGSCQTILDEVTGKELSDTDAIHATSQLATEVIKIASLLATRHESRRFSRIRQMIEHPKDKIFALTFTDRFFRPIEGKRAITLLRDLEQKQPPSFLSKGENKLLKFTTQFGWLCPNLMRSILTRGIRKQLTHIVSEDSSKEISTLVKKLRQENIHTNINRIGEAILGEQEALARLKSYITDLKNPLVEMVSVKISSICSQLNLLAFNETLKTLQERFKTLLREAKSNQATVMLDMEEWKDLTLTSTLLTTALDDPEFIHSKAGIALQAYIPYSSTLLEELIAWSKSRHERGGNPIHIRLVKGANLAMERVEASLKCWPQAPFKKKEDTDAHFIYMLHRLLQDDVQDILEIGIGSHNLFDLCYAGVLAASKKRLKSVYFETLSGMAPSLTQALAKVFPNSLLYCPVVAPSEFHAALAYLTRRLDENTNSSNFLSALYHLNPDSPAWHRQFERFELSVNDRIRVVRKNRRDQNRQSPTTPLPPSPFQNSPDTDWSLKSNQEWGRSILTEWQHKPTRQIPLQIAGELISGITSQTREDPSIPGKIIHEHQLAGPNQIEKAILSASQDPYNISFFDLADALESHRGRLIGAIVQEVGKSVPEADLEVSEAIDMVRYYGNQLIDESFLFSPNSKGGIALVASPWNFPCSIPLNGIIAALATNHAVLFKPAPEAIGVGFELVNILWEAGISQKALQFIPTRDDPEGHLLLQDKRISTVFLTGSTETGRLFLKSCPSRRLFAETGGKNAIIVTQTADLDIAIKEIIQSAFSYSGQKCSACSVVIVEKSVLHHSQFLEKLADSATSLHVGSAWDPTSKITPLAKPPSDAFLRALNLEESERWLVEPKQDPLNPMLYSPGIKIGVKPHSFMHMTELFGPIISIIGADSLSDAIHIANQTPYGLTAGLISLDPKEHDLFKRKIEAGNRYINRAITGAVVGRQPFGGMKASSFGTGMKAGGPSFLLQLLQNDGEALPHTSLSNHKQLHLTCLLLPIDENMPLVDVSRGYAAAFETYFSKNKVLQTCLGQDNYLTYEKHNELFLYISPEDSFTDIWKIASAAALIGTELHIAGSNLSLKQFCRVVDLKSFALAQGWHWYNTPDDFLEALLIAPFPRIRAINAIPQEILKRAASRAFSIEIKRPVDNGRIELIHFLKEISFSSDYHRFGNLQEREHEVRTEPK